MTEGDTRARQPACQVRCVIWNVNGLTNKRENLYKMTQTHDPDMVLLTETKRSNIVDLGVDLACDYKEYRVVQIFSTDCHRGGIILIIRRSIRLETAEVIRLKDGDNFAQGLVMEDRLRQAVAFWYCAPTTSREKFGAIIKRLVEDYDLKLLAGDFNARHPAWCDKHDAKKGELLHEVARKTRGYSVRAPETPNFQAARYRTRGRFGSSTIDLVLSKAPVRRIQCLKGDITQASDHFPVWFTADIKIDRGKVPRRIPKTLLQSTQRREVVGTVYGISLKEAGVAVDKLEAPGTEEANTEEIHQVYQDVQETLKAPWEAQVKKRRRSCGPHVNGELLKLWGRKKLLYDRWRWKPTDGNEKKYRDICGRAQQRERQLKKEQGRREIQRIQVNPEAEVAKALKTSARKRKEQKQIDKATGKQLRAKDFANYLSKNLEGPKEELQIMNFEIDDGKFEKDVEQAIRGMEANKAVGTDGVHVEMMKANPPVAATLLTKVWKAVGRTKQVPEEWLKGIIVPLYKGKGGQKEPANFRPLCILSHARKVVEKAVVLNLDRTYETDKAQYGFQSGIQITQAALSVLAAMRSGAEFIVALDLAKAYDKILKLLMSTKLHEQVDKNLAYQLIVFLLTVTARVTGDVANTDIEMRRGLTQGGTSSPTLFKLFINDLPQAIRAALSEAKEATAGMDPVRLVADDVIGITKTAGGLQVLLDECQRWAEENGLCWNPAKSQVLEVHPQARRLQWN